MSPATDTAPASPMPSPTTEDTAPVSRRRINPWRLFTGSMVPNWLLCRREVSQGAKLAYARLAQYAGEAGHCFPKQSTLARELGVSERAVRDYVRELVEFALMESEQRGLRQSNRYYFLDHAWMQENGSPMPGAVGTDRQSTSGLDRKNSSALERKNSSAPIDEEIQGRESKEEHTPSPSVSSRSLPRNEEEAAEWVSMDGIPEDFAREVFNELEAVDWLDGYKRPVRRWRSHLKHRWAIAQSKRVERQAHARKAPRDGKPGTWEMKTKLESVKEVMKNHPGNPDSECYSPGNPEWREQRNEYRKLEAERERLNKAIIGFDSTPSA